HPRRGRREGGSDLGARVPALSRVLFIPPQPAGLPQFARPAERRVRDRARGRVLQVSETVGPMNIAWPDFAAALGLLLVVEGILPFLNPHGIKRLLATMATMEDDALR